MKEKKFKTKVAMICNQEQLDKIQPKLERLGYDIFNYGRNTFRLCTNWDGRDNRIGTDSTGVCFIKRDYILDTWNEDLFLALAAIVEGDVIHKGEWCDSRESGVSPYGDWAFGNKAAKDRNNICVANKIYAPKATAEQLIEHFTNKQNDMKEELTAHVICHDGIEYNRETTKLEIQQMREQGYLEQCDDRFIFDFRKPEPEPKQEPEVKDFPYPCVVKSVKNGTIVFAKKSVTDIDFSGIQISEHFNRKGYESNYWAKDCFELVELVEL